MPKKEYFMSSLMKKYIEEREEVLVIEHDYGFATGRPIANDTFYIEDVYIIPEERGKSRSIEITEELKQKALETKKYKYIATSVDLATKNSDYSLMLILQKGYRIDSINGTFIMLKKET
jgi:hypothetical protein